MSNTTILDPQKKGDSMKGNRFFMLSLILSLAGIPLYGRTRAPGAVRTQALSAEKNLRAHTFTAKKGHREDCARTFKICEVPVIIDQPGKWFVCKDLTYNGTGTAILITANNVTLDLLNHDLIVADGATGIEAQNVRELVIKNDLISTPIISQQVNSTAIYLTGCEKVTLENIFTSNTYTGLLLDTNCVDISVNNCHFKDHTGASTGNGSAVFDTGSSSLTFDHCLFEGTSGALPALMTFFQSSTNVRFTSCVFSNADIGIAFGGSGLLVENCQLFGSQTNNFNLIQLGIPGTPPFPALPAFDITIKDTTAISTVPNNPGFDCITAGQGSGLILENVIIDSQGRAIPIDVPFVGGLHLGSSLNPSSFNDVIVSKTVIRNQNDNGLLSEAGSTGMLVTDSTISGAVTGIHLYGTQASTIKSSLINFNNEGIVLETGSTGNSVVNNTISTNTSDGVNLNGTAGNVVVNNVIKGAPQIVNPGANTVAPNFLI